MGGDTAKYVLDHKTGGRPLASSADVEKRDEAVCWSKTENNYRAISYYDYSLKTPADTGGTIVLVFANGAIMDGEENARNVGGDTTYRRSATHVLILK